MKSTQESAERCVEEQPIDGHVGIGERRAREWEIVGKGGETRVFSFGEARDFLALKDPENQVVANVGDGIGAFAKKSEFAAAAVVGCEALQTNAVHDLRTWPVCDR